MLSGVDLLKLDDQTSQTDNHDKYIEVSRVNILAAFIICAIFNYQHYF